MKITSDQLAALQLQQKNKARSASGDGFASALAEELDSGSAVQTGAPATPAAPMARLDQTLQAAMLNKTTRQTVMDKMDTLLSKWENYSQIIGASNGNLREGYSLLADIRQDIRAVKSDLAQTPNPGEGLETMVEDLDILATTEEFKFNRGDYLN